MLSNYVSAQDVARGLANWEQRSGPKYIRLAEALIRFLALHNFAAGTRLPSERALTAEIDASRGTVIRAYGHLTQSGYIDRKRNSGTVVARSHLVTRRIRQSRWESLDKVLEQTPQEHLLYIGAPYIDETLRGISITLEDLRSSFIPPHGIASSGLFELRRLIAQRTSSSWRETSTDEVLITSGTHSGLALIFDLLAQPSMKVIVEAPTYPAILELAVNTGVKILPVSCDGDGPIPGKFEEAAQLGDIAFAYLMPTAHHPTGRIMSFQRRRRLLEICQRHQIPIVEDLANAELVFSNDDVPPSLYELSDGGGVIALGSFSKTLWSGFHVGWAVSDGDTILMLNRQRMVRELHGGILEQLVVLQLAPRIEEILLERRELLRVSFEQAADFLATNLPDWELSKSRGGYNLWIRLPSGSGDDFAATAARRGILIEAGSSYGAEGQFQDFIRLALGMPVDSLYRALLALEEAWQVYKQKLDGTQSR